MKGALWNRKGDEAGRAVIFLEQVTSVLSTTFRLPGLGRHCLQFFSTQQQSSSWWHSRWAPSASLWSLEPGPDRVVCPDERQMGTVSTLAGPPRAAGTPFGSHTHHRTPPRIPGHQVLTAELGQDGVGIPFCVTREETEVQGRSVGAVPEPRPLVS